MKTKNYKQGMPLIVIFLTGLLMISNAAKAQIGHMNQDINNHVMLTNSKSTNGPLICSFSRVFPDGEIEEFKIPSNKQLVITDVEWQARNKIVSGGKYDGFPVDFEAGDAVWLEINLTDATVFSSRTIRVQTKGAGVGSSEQLTTGLVIGGRFCGRVQLISYPIIRKEIGDELIGNFGDGFLILRGYLINAEGDAKPKENS